MAGNQGASSELLFHTPEIAAALAARGDFDPAFARHDAHMGFRTASVLFDERAWPDDRPTLSRARRINLQATQSDSYIYFNARRSPATSNSYRSIYP